MKLAVIRDENCTRCTLHQTTERVCALSEPKQCDLMIVGEAPGQAEEKTGLLFNGSSGRLLWDALEQHSIERDDVFVANAVNCRPPSNRTPKKGEIKACRDWMKQQIAVVKPKFILILGNTPLISFTGKAGIKKKRGRPWEENGIIYFATYHPSFILRDDRNRPAFEADLRFLSEIIQHGGVPREKALDFIIVDTPGKFEAMLADLNGTVSFDIESTGLYPWAPDELLAVNPNYPNRPRRPGVVSIGFGTRKHQWCWPIGHPGAPRWENIQRMIRRVSERLADCIICGQFMKFDTLWLLVKYGVKWLGDFDTGLAHYMLDENARHGLKELAQIYCGAPNYDEELKLKTGESGTLAEHCLYLAHDVYYTRRLRYMFAKELVKDEGVRRVFDHLLMECAKVFVDIENHGVFIDVSRMDEVEKILRDELETAERDLNYHTKKFGKFNWRSPQQLAKLFFEHLKMSPLDKTKGGKNSTNESVLKRLDHPAAEALIRYRGANQLLQMFIDGWRPFIDGNNRLHPSFKLHGTVTGRPSCVRRGTQITIPGGTKAIEDIKIGDWVYGFDEQKQLTIRRVKAATRTGKKPIWRIYWTGKGGQHEGYLDITRDHLVRQISGDYIRVDQLRGGRFKRWRNRYHGGEHILALHRYSNKRNFLYATGYKGKIRESRIVFESLHGWSPDHIHHGDENPLNDHPENLIGLSAHDHVSLHMKQRTRQQKRNAALKRSPETLNRIANAIRQTKKKEFESRFTRQQVEQALKQAGGILKAKKILRCSYDALKRRIDEWGLWQPDGRQNHMVARVEQLGIVDDVYDLEIDGIHNFIANELCLHNCEHPNLQQVPRDERIRSLVCAPEGWTLVEIDLSQIEMRIAAELSGDSALYTAFTTGVDVHWLTAMREISRGGSMAKEVLETALKVTGQKQEYGAAIDILLKIGPDACAEIWKEWKEIRKKAKAVNFGYLFGMWWKKFKLYARDNYGIHVTDKEAQQSRESFFQLYKGLGPWHDRQRLYARRNGYVRSLSGAKRRLPQAMSSRDTPERAESWRQAINSPVQRFAAELNLMVLIQLVSEFSRDVLRPVGTIHDAVLFEVREDMVLKVAERALIVMRRPKMLDDFDIRLRVPIEGDVKIGPWGKGVSIAKWKAANVTRSTKNASAVS